ncbi:MAG: hypothetical protein ABWZ52_01245 [Acidimicrobiales bacterium]
MTADDLVRAEPVDHDRVAELIGGAAYGSILLLSGLVLLEATDIGTRHGLEVVLGIGMATWIAHLFAELLAEHARHNRPLRWAEVGRAAVDGSPILLVTILPAAALLLGRIDVVGYDTARTLAIVVALAQLSLVGALVGHLSPNTTRPAWSFAAVVALAGVVVVAVEVALSH